MKKRMIAAALLCSLTLTGTACAAAPADISSAVQAGAQTADPAQARTLTRAGFVQLLAEASGEDYAASTENYFSDTSSPAVNWAYEKWLVNGSDSGLFRPDEAVTREQAAAILGRYLDYRYTALPGGCGTGMPSMDNVASWAQTGVQQCWMYDVIPSDGTDFNPKAPMTGAQGALFVENANNLTVAAVGEPETRPFADALVSAAQPTGNWTLSPYSAQLCLAMLANGAAGETQRELLAALGISDLDAFNRQVQQQLNTYDSYARILSLDTANSVWLNQSRYGGAGAFVPAFQKNVQDFYRAEVREVTDENSVEQVNQWVNEKTNGKIPSILTEDNRKFVAALVNAVYFKAAWAEEFPAYATEKADFTNEDGSKTQVDMMHNTAHYGYYATPGIEAVQLDYRKYACDNEDGDNWEYFSDADLSMYFIKAADSLDVQSFLDQAAFTEETEVALSLPKFKIEYGQSLDDALRALGVTAAFDKDLANLTAMTPGTPMGNVYLDTVLQKTYLAVDEKGTEAAAVTAAMTGDASAMIDRAPLVRTFTADEPFWFAIRDNASGTLLFVGRYVNAA